MIFCNINEDIEESLDYTLHFSDVIASYHKIPSKGIAIISFNNESINCVTTYKKTGRVATQKDRITFKNGYPNFSKWSKAKMKFKNLDGTTKDFDKVYERIAKQKGFKNKTQAKKYLKEKGLTPHHHQDGKTIELIPSDLHNSIPHVGGTSNLRNG